MYERFYDLRERPFALSPDPDYLYPSRVHREALDYLRYGLESHAGFIVITGEIGSGKTTLLQTVLRGLDSQTTVARIVNTMLEPRELLETIMIDLGIDPGHHSKPMLLRDLGQYLVDQRLAGRMVLLVIDEAQNLSLGALEELRMLSNLETEKSKLLQIVLVGQPNLRDKLNAPELEQLRQRITVSYHLQPLDAGETENYINHRLKRAALGVPMEFPRQVTDAVHARSRGVPRIINVICDAALVFGYAEERRQIDLELIEEVLEELETTGVLPPIGRPVSGSPVSGGPLSGRPVPGGAVLAGSVPGTKVSDFSAPDAGHRRADGYRTPDLELRTPDTGPRIPDTGYRIPDTGHRISDTGYRIPDTGHRTPDTAQRTARDLQLEQRENAVKQRERELAEQRRILAEEYRLLRSRMTAGVNPPSASVRVQSPMHMSAVRHESFWTRVKRALLGTSAPAHD